MLRQEIEQAVKNALAELGAPEAAFVVERPGDMSHGDYSTNAALAASKLLKKNPREVAEELVTKLQTISGIEKVEMAGAGFINFFVSHSVLVEEIEQATKEGWGKNNAWAGEKILVEYTSPNLFKPLHIGNLMSNILGESIARLFEFSGANVVRINYPSDIGLTVAKGIWGLRKSDGDPKDINALGEAYRIGSTAYEDDPEAKKQIDSLNIEIYTGFYPELENIRKIGVQTSLSHLNDICKKLGTEFNTQIFESETAAAGRNIVEKHPEIFEKSDGATVFHAEKYNTQLHTRVFINSLNIPTYEAKDLGLFEIKIRKYPDFSYSFTVTSVEQQEYFKVLIEAITRIFSDVSENKKKVRHIQHGFLKLTTGKMSSRKGNVITAESLLSDLQEDAKEKMKDRALSDVDKIAEQVAVGAIKYAVLKQGRGKDIVFDPAKSLSLEGDSGPYLQYTLVRVKALLEKAILVPEVDHKKASYDEDFKEFGLGYRLMRILIHFPDIVFRATAEAEPHHVTTYLTELASVFNSWYGTERILVDGQIGKGGKELIKAVEKTLAKGLSVLGIPAPEKM